MSEKRADEQVSLAKGGGGAARPARPARPVRPDVAPVPAPRTIEITALIGGLLVLALWVRALGLLGQDSALLKYVTHANDTASKHDKNFNAVSSVHNLRVGTVINAALVTVIVLLLVWAIRRTRSASAARWGVLIFLVLLGLPFSVIPTWGLPILAQAAGVVSGLSAIAMIVLVFLPPSTQYFRECRDAMTPPELRGQARPGLGSLFKPRQAAAAGAAPSVTRQTGGRPTGGRPAASTTSKAKAKAKVRSDAEAVAKGAELARTRAKSSKSRRPE